MTGLTMPTAAGTPDTISQLLPTVRSHYLSPVLHSSTVAFLIDIQSPSSKLDFRRGSGVSVLSASVPLYPQEVGFSIDVPAGALRVGPLPLRLVLDESLPQGILRSVLCAQELPKES